MLGPDGDLAKLTKWAEPAQPDSLDALYQPIKRANEAWSNICPR